MAATLAEGNALTSTEVAAVASVSTRYLSHLIEEHFLPVELYAREGRRWFRPSAAAFAAFDNRVADILTPSARRTIIREMVTRHHAELAESDAWLQWSIPCLENLGIIIDLVKVDMTESFRNVGANMGLLFEARQMVVRDPEILSGTPVIRGTRIAVYDVAASAENGLPLERILKAYSDLTEHQVALARLWVKANPPMGRPKRAVGPADRATVMAKRVVRRRKAA